MFLSGRDHLCELLPHTGGMCLLDDILEWDETSILCRTTSHRDPDNPLRHRDRLPAVCSLEYVGQATYLHGVLTITRRMDLGDVPDRPPLAFVAALRGLNLEIDRLDGIEGPLDVRVSCQAWSPDASSYAFAIEADGRKLASGRLTSKILWEELPV